MWLSKPASDFESHICMYVLYCMYVFVLYVAIILACNHAASGLLCRLTVTDAAVVSRIVGDYFTLNK